MITNSTNDIIICMVLASPESWLVTLRTPSLLERYNSTISLDVSLQPMMRFSKHSPVVGLGFD